MKDAFERRRFVPILYRGRVSSDRADPGYGNYQDLMAGGYKVAVLLNGVEQSDCLMADPEEGVVCRHRTVRGRPVIHGDAFQTEVLRGEVTVRLTRPSK